MSATFETHTSLFSTEKKTNPGSASPIMRVLQKAHRKTKLKSLLWCKKKIHTWLFHIRIFEHTQRAFTSDTRYVWASPNTPASIMSSIAGDTNWVSSGSIQCGTTRSHRLGAQSYLQMWIPNSSQFYLHF